MSCSLQQKNPMLHFIYWEQFLGLFLDFHEFFMLSKIADQSFHRLCLKESLSHIFIPIEHRSLRCFLRPSLHLTSPTEHKPGSYYPWVSHGLISLFQYVQSLGCPLTLPGSPPGADSATTAIFFWHPSC